jgi:hypothetical protein
MLLPLLFSALPSLPIRRRLCSPKYPFLLRVLLGKNVPAVTLRKEQAIAIREDYHAFRSKAVWIMFIVPLMLYLGMKRADSVVKGEKYHHSTLTLTPPLLTGKPVGASGGGGVRAGRHAGLGWVG